MGLDIYAGTLTRYYLHNWKTVVQQFAEEHGIKCNIIRAHPVETNIDEKELISSLESWRDQILSAVTPEGQTVYTPWREDNEIPYYTDKPDWDAFGALLLYAACLICKEPLPPTVEKNWDYWSHPLICKITENENNNCSIFSGVEWWLPIDDVFMFQGPAPNGNKIMMGTTEALRNELNEINKLGWQADEETILNWRNTEGYPTDLEIPAKPVTSDENTVKGNPIKKLWSKIKVKSSEDSKISLQNMNVHEQYDTESLAKFAFSILWHAVRFSEENKVPILLDY